MIKSLILLHTKHQSPKLPIIPKVQKFIVYFLLATEEHFLQRSKSELTFDLWSKEVFFF